MKILKIALPILIVIAAAVAWAAPIGPLPGLFIGGTSAPAPATWPDTSELHEIKLEVATGLLPRVVIIWVVQVGGELHVVGANDSGWTRAIGNGAPVRVRMGDDTYALQATRVSAGWERVLQAYIDKYRPDYPDIVAGFPTVDEAAGTTAVFRLTRSG